MLHSHANGSSFSHNEVLFNEEEKPYEFEGIIMDDGSQKSQAEIQVYKRYCNHAHIPFKSAITELLKLRESFLKILGTSFMKISIQNS